jgi:hypothetical protein
LSLERQFGSWFGQIAYNGSAGRHLYTQSDANQAKWIGYPENPTPGQKELQWAPTANNILGEAINPAFANIWVLAPRGSSYYNGLSVSAQRRVARGLQFQAAYNFSKNIDYGSGSSNAQDNLPQNQRINFNRVLPLTIFPSRLSAVRSASSDLRAFAFLVGRIMGYSSLSHYDKSLRVNQKTK